MTKHDIKLQRGFINELELCECYLIISAFFSNCFDIYFWVDWSYLTTVLEIKEHL